jgi:hypothetical protein
MIDFIYLALGAGVQSGTLAEMIVEGELSRPDVAIFADTGDEPDYVYSHVEYLCGRLAGVDVPLVTVSAGNIIEDAMSSEGRFATMPLFTRRNGKVGRMRRQCTREYKVEPIEREVRSRLLALGLAKRTTTAVRIDNGVAIECWLGLSLDEVARMRPSRVPAIENRWPLLDRRMTRHSCKLWLNQRDLPIPGKSSCKRCPYHNDAYLRDKRNNRPGDWQDMVEFDAFLRSGDSRLAEIADGDLYLHRQCIPLDEVDLRTEQDNGQMDFLDICDEGHCGI